MFITVKKKKKKKKPHCRFLCLSAELGRGFHLRLLACFSVGIWTSVGVFPTADVLLASLMLSKKPDLCSHYGGLCGVVERARVQESDRPGIVSR